MAATSPTPNIKKKLKNSKRIAQLENENKQLKKDKDACIREIEVLKSKVYNKDIDQTQTVSPKMFAEDLMQNQTQKFCENDLFVDNINDTKDNKRAKQIKIFNNLQQTDEKQNLNEKDKLIMDDTKEIDKLLSQISELKETVKKQEAAFVKLEINNSKLQIAKAELMKDRTESIKLQEENEILQKEIVGLKEDNTKFEMTLLNMKTENSNLQLDKDRLTNDKTGLELIRNKEQEKNKRLQNEIFNLKNMLIKHEAAINDLKNDNSSLQHSKEILAKEKTDFLKQIEILHSEKSKLKEHTSNNIAKILVLERENSNLYTSKETLSKTIETLQEAISAKSTEIENLKQVILKLEEGANNFESTIDNLRKENSLLLINIDTLRLNASDNTAKISMVLREFFSIHGSCELLQEKLEKLQEDNKKKSTQIEYLEQIISTLKKDTYEHEVTIDKLQQENSNLQKDIKDNIGNIDTLSLEKSQLLDSKELLRGKVEVMGLDIQSKTIQINNLEKEVFHLKENINENETKIRNLEFENLNFSHVVQTYIIKVNESNVLIKNYLKEISNLKQEIKDAIASNDALLFENAGLMIAKEELTKKLIKDQKQIQELKKHHAELLDNIKSEANKKLSQCTSEKTDLEKINKKLNDDNNLMIAKISQLENDIAINQVELKNIMDDKIDCFNYYRDVIPGIETENFPEDKNLTNLIKRLHNNIKEEYIRKIDELSDKFNSLYPCDKDINSTNGIKENQNLVQELEEKSRICRQRFKIILRRDEEKKRAEEEIKNLRYATENLEEKVIKLINQVEELKAENYQLEGERKSNEKEIAKLQEKLRAPSSPLRPGKVHSSPVPASSREQRKEWHDRNRNLDDIPQRKRPTSEDGDTIRIENTEDKEKKMRNKFKM